MDEWSRLYAKRVALREKAESSKASKEELAKYNYAKLSARQATTVKSLRGRASTLTPKKRSLTPCTACLSI